MQEFTYQNNSNETIIRSAAIRHQQDVKVFQKKLRQPALRSLWESGMCRRITSSRSPTSSSPSGSLRITRPSSDAMSSEKSLSRSKWVRSWQRAMMEKTPHGIKHFHPFSFSFQPFLAHRLTFSPCRPQVLSSLESLSVCPSVGRR